MTRQPAGPSREKLHDWCMGYLDVAVDGVCVFADVLTLVLLVPLSFPFWLIGRLRASLKK